MRPALALLVLLVPAAAHADRPTTIVGEALHSEDAVTGGTKDGVMLNIQQTVNKFLQAEFGVRHAREATAPSQLGGVAPNDITSLRTKLSGKLPQLPKLSLTGEYEQSVNYGDRRLAAAGAEYQLRVAIHCMIAVECRML
jgi:hypothetical protein